MKGVFCDCFGPFRLRKDNLDGPLDQNTLNRCLELVRAHEARQINKVKFIRFLLEIIASFTAFILFIKIFD